MVSQPQIARLLQRQAAAGDVIFLNHLCCACLVTQSHPTLVDSMDCSPPGSSVHGILQARILEEVAIPFSRDLPDSGIELQSPVLQAGTLPLRFWEW